MAMTMTHGPTLITVVFPVDTKYHGPLFFLFPFCIQNSFLLPYPPSFLHPDTPYFFSPCSFYFFFHTPVMRDDLTLQDTFLFLPFLKKKKSIKKPPVLLSGLFPNAQMFLPYRTIGGWDR